jgi:hypothetical protein
MKLTKLFIFLAALAALTACQKEPTHFNPGGYTGANKVNNTTIHDNKKPSSETHGGGDHAYGGESHFKEVERPQRIAEMAAQRGEQENAAPVLRVVSPANNSTVNSSTVRVKIELTGDLKGYSTGMNPETKMGNHIHVILDNQPYEAYYNLNQEFELRNVSDGEHTLRFFPSRPWHESYKNEGAFQMVRFTVKNGGGDASKPTTTNTNQTVANPAATPEGKEMAQSSAGAVDPARPLLTYSRPKGDYKGEEADPIMIDFWLSNARLAGDGGEYRVRLSIDGKEIKMIDRWQPIWLAGWSNGKHSVKLDLVDQNGNLVENGGYNSTTREITVAGATAGGHGGH